MTSKCPLIFKALQPVSQLANQMPGGQVHLKFHSPTATGVYQRELFAP